MASDKLTVLPVPRFLDGRAPCQGSNGLGVLLWQEAEESARSLMTHWYTRTIALVFSLATKIGCSGPESSAAPGQAIECRGAKVKHK